MPLTTRRQLHTLCNIAIGVLLVVHWAWNCACTEERNRQFVDAAFAGDTTRVRELLDQGVRPDDRPFHSMTAVQGAAYNRHRDTVQLLLDRGADAKSALPKAAENGDAVMLAILLARSGPLTAAENASLLGQAADCGDLVCVKLMLRRGADVNAPGGHSDMDGLAASWTPIQHAAASGSWEVFHALIEHGADCSVRSSDGGKLLHLAASSGGSGAAAICRYLVRHGMYVNSQDGNGQTALIDAVYVRGPDADAAAKALPKVEALLNSGADPGISDYSNRTALDYADEGGLSQIADRLKSALDKTKRAGRLSRPSGAQP